MHSFEDAKGFPLHSDAQFARFVDPAVTGADRQLAIQLLKAMPPEMRGDFVYVSGYGHVMSNRPELASKVHFFEAGGTSSESSKAPLIRGALGIHPLTYPPTGGSGGPFIRYYSYQGINAAYGYASLPCNSVYHTGDNGNMYFNAYDSNGGDVVDAGITQGNSGFPSTIEYPFVRTTSGPVYYGWTNESQLWQCGIPPVGYALGIMYGTLPATVAPDKSFLAVGIPDFDPTKMQMPPTEASWNHSAWTFFNTPSELMQSPGTWNGITSPCMFCSVGRMTTIAQSAGNPVNDGSCFGACLGVPEARWDEVVMGEIVAPCQNNNTSPPSAVCTIEYQSNGVWANGGNHTCPGAFWSEYNQQDGLEGINTSSTYCGSTTTSQSAFATDLPKAPSSPCAPDSMGYCAIVVRSVLDSTCEDGYRYVNGSEIPKFLRSFDRTYEIFKQQAMLELQETATEKESMPSEAPCTITTTWSPNDPRVKYGDSALP